MLTYLGVIHDMLFNNKTENSSFGTQIRLPDEPRAHYFMDTFVVTLKKYENMLILPLFLYDARYYLLLSVTKQSLLNELSAQCGFA